MESMDTTEHFLTFDGKNYKVPEWFSIDKMNAELAAEVAERLIEYKIRMSEQ